jgi:hypothetical protein
MVFRLTGKPAGPQIAEKIVTGLAGTISHLQLLKGLKTAAAPNRLPSLSLASMLAMSVHLYLCISIPPTAVHWLLPS